MKAIQLRNEPIAVIGMACRFPGGNSPEAFWDFLLRGGDAVREVPRERWDVAASYDPDPNVPGKMYTKSGAFLPDFDQFSPAFFGISPREAQFMDPQQRLLLEVSWEALENAAVVPEKLAEKQVGIFVGIGTTDYGDSQVPFGAPAVDAYNGTGGSHAAAAGRLSYFLGVRGPSLAVDTACSSSLVTAHLAMMSLRSGESDLALASGVNLNFAPDVFISLCKARMLSPDGRCKTFDAGANGYVRGEGCGVVVLKRLSDALAEGDHILALLRGSAVNHNGRSSGLTVPSGPAQQGVVRTALRNAGIEPSEVSYIEAHGTGTPVGDPIEAGALGAVFAGRTEPLLIGSVKTNTGHLEWAAGVCGLIKVILAMQHGVIPQNLHLQHPNPLIPWDKLPLRVVTEPTTWPRERRIAGVSSFGFGGTNAHVIVEEAPKLQCTPSEVERPLHVLTLTAKSESDLRRLAERYVERTAELPSEKLPDLCYTANTGRSRFEYRLTGTATSNEVLAESLRSFVTGRSTPTIRTGRASANPPSVTMLFTGQGSQLPGMGRELYRTQPTFRRTIDRCDALLRGYLDIPLTALLHAPDDGAALIHETAYTQPALFALEYALAELWQAWGVRPDAVLGHSVGEFAAACVADVFSLEDGLKLIAARGRLMQALPRNGAMAAIRAGEDRVAPLIAPHAARVTVAAVNGPTDVVISGEAVAVEEIAAQAAAMGMAVQKLKVSHAFHSPLMDPILDEFRSVAERISYRRPRLSLISNVTGREAGDEAATPDYWVRHIRAPVRFASGIETAASLGATCFVEVGPQPVLCGLGRLCLPADTVQWLPSLHAKREDWQQMLDSLAALEIAGAEIDWDGFDRDYHRAKLVLPTYPFERQRYWFPAAAAGRATATSALRPLVTGISRSPLVKETVLSLSLGLASHPYFADHKVHDQVVVPGAAYLALLASASELLGRQSCRLHDVYFLAPLVLAESGERTIQAVLTPQEQDSDKAADESAFQIVLLPPDENEEPLRLASGRVGSAPATSASSIDLAALRKRCGTRLPTEQLFEGVAAAGVELGASFRWVSEVWLGQREALGRLTVPDAIPTLDGYVIHPALLDGCFQIAGATLAGEPNETLLPFAVRSLEILRPAKGTTWWCHAARTADATWDICLFDGAGEMVAVLGGFEMRKAPVDRFLRPRTSDWFYRTDWVVRPLTARPDPAAPGTWLIFSNGGEIGLALAQRLVQRGERCVVVAEGDAFDGSALDPSSSADLRATINPAVPADIQTLLEKCASAGLPPCRAFVHLWSIERDRSDESRALHAEASAIGLLHLAQAAPPARLLIVTSGGQSVRAGEDADPAQAPAWGLLRSLLLEAPDRYAGCLDIEPGSSPVCADAILAEFGASAAEPQVALRGSERYVARLVRFPQALATPARDSFRLQLADYGSPDQLRLVPMARRTPRPDEVEIEVKATALNFRDVLTTLGMLKDFYAQELGITRAADIHLGFDCAGVITAVGERVTGLAVGDRVMAAAAGGSASHVTIYRECVTKMPSGLDFTTAAAIPNVFWTAYYGLVQLANLKAGDRVLIHAAAGGVGLAAIQIAQAAGAEIFATASPAKWDYLKTQGITHIMNSRALDFADEIMQATGGAGVDVVLNSLGGAAIEKSFSVLASGGRFIELGKIGIWTPEETASRRPDATYYAFELGEAIDSDPAMFQANGEKLLELFESGVFHPLPQTVFPIENAVDAYRFMQQAKHVGKVVLTLEQAELTRISPDVSYLITGGLGGLGLKVAGCLVAAGARHIVLSGRREASAAALEAIEVLRLAGASVSIVRGDVARASDVAAMIEACQAKAPLLGVVHAAGIIQDGLLRNQTAERFASVMAPKVAGAWQLHLQTRALPLDFFICFSSMASLVGSPGQTNYAAANAFLDALAHHRRANGLPAISINWGPWAEIGMAANIELPSLEIEKLDVASAVAVFAALVQMPQRLAPAQLGVLKMRWESFLQRWSASDAVSYFSSLVASKAPVNEQRDEFLKKFRAAPAEAREALLMAHIQDALLLVLALDKSTMIEPARPWIDLGLDSLMMVELKNRLERSLRVSLPVEILMRDVGTRSLANFLLGDKLSDARIAEQAQAQPEEPGKEEAVGFEIFERVFDIPQVFTTVDAQQDRKVLIGGRWRLDFASCNYLGFDLEPEIMAAIPPAIERWGVHPSWSRAVASPALYAELERELAVMVAARDTLVFPSISLLHLGVLPAIAGDKGVILKDAASHHSIQEACLRAQANGVEWFDFKHNDVDDLARKLAQVQLDRVKVIATDGAYSMGSPNPPLREYVRLAQTYNATIYVDDAHGFGIFGADPDEAMPYGHGGNGIVRRMGLDYDRDRIVYVAGLSKAFSSYAAFVTCSDERTKMWFQASGPYVFSGPTAVASLASALAGLRLNRRDGDARRLRIHRMTHRLVGAAKRIGFEVDNDGDFPIVGIVIGDWDAMVAACRLLWDHDILITPATYPAVPINRNLVRFSITSANTDEELDQAITALEAVWEALHLQPIAARSEAALAPLPA